jgi:mRNA-degrading endonuclease RelE of RelBE toxin-antitoxin system
MIIKWKEKARKQIKKLKNYQAKERILATIDLYATGGLVDIIALTNHEYTHRIRVGDYRILINILSEEVQVTHIEEVKKRDDTTY